jgi:NAD(P)-dependent dehydrogenase (short-subunit alcohol dehydrogenase family)
MTELKLAGRRAIITGGSRGLGFEISRRFLSAGADVAICSRALKDIEAAASRLREEFPQRRVFARECDLSIAGDAGAFFDAVLDQFGSIDCLVNNAGIQGQIGPVDEVEWESWERVIQVNLLAVIQLCSRAIRHFKARPASAPRAKIINLSGGGATGPRPGLSAYAASKAAVVRTTETLAHECLPLNIDVNAVAPGTLATRMMEELRTAGPGRIGAGDYARLEDTLASGGDPLDRPAELCVYLASSASDALTGRLISAVWDPWPFSREAVASIMDSDIYTLRRIVPQDREGWAG